VQTIQASLNPICFRCTQKTDTLPDAIVKNHTPNVLHRHATSPEKTTGFRRFLKPGCPGSEHDFRIRSSKQLSADRPCEGIRTHVRMRHSRLNVLKALLQRMVRENGTAAGGAE
jgi:hypothetical protein